MDERRTVDLWSLNDNVAVESGEDGDDVLLTSPWGAERIENAPQLVHEALRRMELGPVLLNNLTPEPDNPVTQASVYVTLIPTLRRLAHLVVRTLGLVDLRGPLLSVYPLTPTALFALTRLPATGHIRLARGATLTLAGAGFTLERVGCEHRVLLHRPEAVWVVGMLASAVTADEVSEAMPLPSSVTQDILDYLAAACMVTLIEPVPRVSTCPDPGGVAGGVGDGGRRSQ
jgi:hypothetical protein